MRKVLLLLLGVLVMFVACQQDEFYDAMAESNVLEENGESISHLETRGLYSPEYMPLDSIPEWAQQKMTIEEYGMWRIIATKYMVDYSFLNTPYYANNKAYIYDKVKVLCDNINEGIVKESGDHFTVMCPEYHRSNLLTRIERMSDPEDGGAKNLSYRVTVCTNSPVSVEYTVIYTYIANDGFRIWSSEFIAHPSDAKFKGAKSGRITPDGYLHASCEGTVEYKKQEYKISGNVTCLLSKE